MDHDHIRLYFVGARGELWEPIKNERPPEGCTLA